jgi:glycosyltransferase involved in cell wall biosynthesis
MGRLMLSVITVNRNDAEGLGRSVASVLSQEQADFEYLVVDGGSTDGSLEVIRSAQARIAWWASEPDGGIYEAMNKGIARAKGDYCLFLNSGDSLLGSDAIARICAALAEGPDVLYSDLLIVDGGKARLDRNPRKVSASYFLINTLNHQNSVVKRSLFSEFGPYRQDLRIASDWFFFLKASSARKLWFKYFPTPIAEYDASGLSSRPEGAALNERERAACKKELFSGMEPIAEELEAFANTVYGSILRHYGSTKALDFILRAYRFAARCLSRLGIRAIK